MAAPPNAHLQRKNKYGVKDHIEDSADDHGEHGVFGTAVCTDHGVDGPGDHHERKANPNRPAIVQRIGAQRIRSAEQRQDRVDEKQEGCGQDDADHGHQGHSVADPPFRAVHMPFPQFETQEGGATVTDHHGQGQGDDRDGEHDVGGAVAQIAHPVADKDLIDNVVKRVYQQRNDAGHGKFDNEPPDGFCGKGALFFRRHCLHG